MSPAIIDLGCGNIGALAFAFERLGAPARITSDPAAIAEASHVVLPGVGAARHAMARIEALGLGEILPALRQPVLGICLGMQLLFERSQEQQARCLGILKGEVARLEPGPRRPVPHMGWSRIRVRARVPGVADGDYFYFAHSFACPPGPHCAATVDHGGPVPAIVRSANVLGVQFHPERSGPAGARLLQEFLRS